MTSVAQINKIEKNIPRLQVALDFETLDAALYMANEGKIVLIVSPKSASKVLGRMKKHTLGRDSQIIGEVETRRDKKVYLKPKAGGTRILDMLTGGQLPRIC